MAERIEPTLGPTSSKPAETAGATASPLPGLASVAPVADTGELKEPDNPAGVAGEQRLHRDLKRSAGHTKGRRAVLVHLSALQPKNRPEHALRSVENSLSGVTGQGAAFYWLRSNDFVVLYSNPLTDAVRSALVKVKFLFAGDPLIRDLYDPHSDPSLATWYNLEADHDTLFSLVTKLVAAQQVFTPSGARLGDRYIGAPQRQRAPLTPATLDRIEKALAGANLSPHVRRQPVCAVVGDSIPEPLFTEIFVSIDDLREALIPHVNLGSDPWLFLRLTQTLDRRVLSMLIRKDDRTLEKGFSVNLNVQTILSDDFLRFDDGLAAARHGTVVLELRAEDVLADLGAFFFARDFVRQRGYRLCVDGLTWQTLPLIVPGELSVDLLKLQWSENLPAILEGPEGRFTRETIQGGSRGRLILSRCDDRRSIRFGQEIGITLFQGRAVDQAIRDFEKS